VTLSAALVPPSQSIGIASAYAEFPSVDGIQGVGPALLMQGTLYPHQNGDIPTVVDNVYKQG